MIKEQLKQMSDERKKRKHNINRDYYGNKLHKEKYGFIEIENPEYYKKDNEYWPVPEFLMRKPTLEERKEIIVNYIIAHNDEHIDMFALADKLCISNRLMQMILKSLREDGLIEVIHTFGDTGKQLRNKYKYIGPSCERYGSGLTLKCFTIQKIEQDSEIGIGKITSLTMMALGTIWMIWTVAK